MEAVGLGMKPTATALLATQDMYAEQQIGSANLSKQL